MDERLLLGLDIPPVGSETACCREVDDADGGAWACCGNMSPPYIAHAETTPIMPANPGLRVRQSHSRITSLKSAKWRNIIKAHTPESSLGLKSTVKRRWHRGRYVTESGQMIAFLFLVTMSSLSKITSFLHKI